MFKRLKKLFVRNVVAGVGASTCGTTLYMSLGNPALLDTLPSSNANGSDFAREMPGLKNAPAKLTTRLNSSEQTLELSRSEVISADPNDIVLENKYCRIVYKWREICGWTVWVDKRLNWTEIEAQLTNDLGHIRRMFPEAAIRAIQGEGRAIWVAKDLSELDDDGNERKQKFACVHYCEHWLRTHGNLREKKNGCLEIYCWEGYRANNLYRVDMLLHEFSHIYHYIIGFDNKTVLKAFEDAKEAKLYDAVEHCSGVKRKAYAMVNVMEYFASLCVPYFYGRNDYYPFIRPQLEEYDKAGFAMLEEVWSILNDENVEE